MKKILAVFTIIILSTSPVIAKKISCNAAMKENKPFVVLYTADYCIYCKKFKPVFSELSKTMDGKYNFVTVDVARNTKNGECDKIDVQSIPTMYVFNPKNGDRLLIPYYLHFRTTQLKDTLDKYYASLN